MKSIAWLVVVVMTLPCVWAQTYLFSNSGDDLNDCITGPCKTIPRLNNLTLFPGDFVRFKCGDVWRVAEEGHIKFANGTMNGSITYSSYGDCNVKSIINTSRPAFTAANLSNSTDDWNETAPNIWLFRVSGPENESHVSHIILNSTRDAIFGSRQNVAKDVNAIHEYFSNITGLHELLVYSEGNPALVYQAGIEIAYNTNSINMDQVEYVIVENLSTRYSGRQGLHANNIRHAIIRNMDVSYFGGGYCCFGDHLWGNGIELWWSTQDVEVYNNIIYHGLDAALTSQGTGDWMDEYAQNQRFHHNIAYNTGYGFELMFSHQSMRIANISVDHNTFYQMDAGVFADMRRNESSQTNQPMCLRVGENYDTHNFSFINNICHESSSYVHGIMSTNVSNFTLQHIYDYNYIHRDTSRGFSASFSLNRAKNQTFTSCHDWKERSGKDQHSICGFIELGEGFRPLAGSILCHGGIGGEAIGALECLEMRSGTLALASSRLVFRNSRLVFK